MRNATHLFRLFWRPAAAMSAILDQGSLLFASAAVISVSLLLQLAVRGSLALSLAFLPLLVIAVVYVPGTLVVTNLIARLGGLGVIFQRDYSPLLTCTSMAWAAVNLPIVAAAWIVPRALLPSVAVLAYVYFAVLMFFAVRTVFGTESRIAVGVSWIPLVAVAFLWAA
jgi:hypothetical protein